MAKKSFFSKVKNYVLERDEDEESIEDIDRRLQAEVDAIKAQKVEQLDGSEMLMEDIDGDLVYVMNLAPMYAIIGGRGGMLGKRLPDVCSTIFDRLVDGKEGRARMKGDYFLMTFVTLTREAGFKRSAQIINEIGIATIGERFKEIEVPGLLVAAEAGDLTNEDGAFDPSKAQEQVESGGTGAMLGDPGDDGPVWLKLSVQKARKAAKLVKMTKAERDGAAEGAGAQKADGAAAPAEANPRRRGDPDWVDERTDRRVRISMDPMQMERRRGRDRRQNK